MNLDIFVSRLLAGRVSGSELAMQVAERWRTGEFIRHLGSEAVPPLGSTLRTVSRCGESDVLRTEVLYGTEGEPGCILITTPSQGGWDESLQTFLVAPHTHRSPHTSLIVRGEAVFVVARELAGETVVITEPVRPGSLTFCQQGIPHTFVSDREFQVASAHASYVRPDRADFATPSEIAFSELPRMTFGELRGAIGA